MSRAIRLPNRGLGAPSFGAAALVTLAVALATSPGAAQPAPSSVAVAQQAFSEGEKAFNSGDFLRAAKSFEAAYAAAPHPDALWNAARAWHRADEAARAANVYAKYLREAAPEAADRNSATAALKELAAKLARVDVFGASVEAITVDGAPIEAGTIYVNPGSHVVRGKSKDRELVKAIEVGAGTVTNVALVEETPAPPPPPTVAASAPPPPTASAPKPPPPSRKPLSPWVTVGASALTAVAGGFLIASALDTQSSVDAYKTRAVPHTDDLKEAALGKERRTNALVAVTAGLGAITAVTTIFFVDFHGSAPSRVEASLGLANASVRGTF